MEKLIVNDTCIGCGLCVAENDKYFEFNDEGFSKVKQEIVETPQERPSSPSIRFVALVMNIIQTALITP